MSLDILYPDNKNCANWMEQLTNDISNMQQYVLDTLHDMDKMGAHMNDLMKEILHQHNLQTVQDLEKKISDALSPKEREAYLKVGIPVFSVFKSGAVSFVCRTYLNAFKFIVRDGNFAAGMRLLSEIRPMANAVLKEGSEASQVFVKISKIVRVIEILGLVVTVVRSQTTRSTTKWYQKFVFPPVVNIHLELQVNATSKYQNSAYSIFVVQAKLKKPQEIKDEIMKDMIESMVEDLEKDLKEFTHLYAYDKLMHKDQESHAWTNENPNYQDTLQYIDSTPELKDISDNILKHTSYVMSKY
ncbi:hypothetical protein RclHR1_13960007 [Rhizophagus clarus]|uniref:Uncharacterized protein n=1 Tax=Rhizophagus clarus TaxID=94130 RepID=A0A2Z6QBB8_9GLOM|nr:hypothetical protein RclHR1_13960007 [Rhizophagus clarus]